LLLWRFRMSWSLHSHQWCGFFWHRSLHWCNSSQKSVVIPIGTFHRRFWILLKSPYRNRWLSAGWGYTHASEVLEWELDRVHDYSEGRPGKSHTSSSRPNPEKRLNVRQGLGLSDEADSTKDTQTTRLAKWWG
jgi:hypothetical protein